MIRVFPRRTKWTPTDELAFVGDPPFEAMRPPEQTVHVSVTFSWDIPEGLRLKDSWARYYSDVHIGGPAFNDRGEEFVPGRYIKEGVTFTSRGCIRSNKSCPWCFVPKREGKLRELAIEPGHIIQDNNLLACSKEHIRAVFEMLQKQKDAAEFPGGLDIRLLKQWHIDLFDSIRFKQLFFSCDRESMIEHFERKAEMLSKYDIRKKRVYVLLGFDEKDTPEKAERRLSELYQLGFMPYAQYFQPLCTVSRRKTDEWHDLIGKWSQPKTIMSQKVNEPELEEVLI